MIETDLHANKYDAMIIAPLQGDMASTLVSGTEMPILQSTQTLMHRRRSPSSASARRMQRQAAAKKAVEAAKAAGWDKIEAAYIAGVQATPPQMHAAPVSGRH